MLSFIATMMMVMAGRSSTFGTSLCADVRQSASAYRPLYRLAGDGLAAQSVSATLSLALIPALLGLLVLQHALAIAGTSLWRLLYCSVRLVLTLPAVELISVLGRTASLKCRDVFSRVAALAELCQYNIFSHDVNLLNRFALGQGRTGSQHSVRLALL